MSRHLAGICGVAIFVCAICVAPGKSAPNANARAHEARQTQTATQTQVAAQTSGTDLNLIPQPRELKTTAGGPFVLTRRTRIVVGNGIGGASFQGAQMLEDEIEQWTGYKLKISAAREMPGSSDMIYIGIAARNAKLPDPRLRDALEKQDLQMAQGFDEHGYAISADAHRILVGGASAEGAFNGVQTLRQLLRPQQMRDTNSGKRTENRELNCPAIAIRDWPAMKWRGVSVDISRGPIPTLKFMENQIRVLAGFKINMYALYMEDVFTVPGHEIFAPPDALTPDEIRALVSYAQKYYVTIVPELETYGHLHNVLRYDVYSQLAEVPHGSVLTPTQPGSYDLLGKMIAAMAPIFSGPFFHIGADETFELGQGQTKELIAEKGLGQVYLDHIAKLDEMLKPYHKQTMFWADIAEKFPQLLPTLPKDIIAVVWTYGNADSYDARLQPFRDAGLPLFVSPGVSNWRRVYPDFNGAYLNIRNLTRDGQKFGALGMLNTEWKDWGEALGGMDWPGFVFGAACAWQPGESSIEQFRDSYDWAFYRNMDHLFESVLDKLAATNTLLDGVKLNGTYTSSFWVDPFSQAGADYAERAAPVTHDVRVNAEQAWQSLLANRSKARDNAETLDDLIFAAHRLDALGMKLEYTTEMSQSYWDAFMNMGDRRRVEHDLGVLSAMNGDLQDLREEMTSLRDDYAKRWRAENREFWLGNVTIRYDAMANKVQEKINAVEALKDNYSRLGELPPPESMGFFVRPEPIQRPH
ncbi:MAG TPA: glycoside hydrolase family 20 zincin-like fold domain-containing protein [Candidatus Acidoferrales bacterium]|nr:glycoside hydrolase family 20 zincin-like fold domain-containing protein [Candidatus Acidoferrales bacterium]